MGSSSSKSSTASTSSTTASDQRQVLDNGALGLSSTGSGGSSISNSLTMNTVDPGIARDSIIFSTIASDNNAKVSALAIDAASKFIVDSNTMAKNAMEEARRAAESAAQSSGQAVASVNSLASKAMDAVAKADAVNGDGFNALIGLAGDLFSGTGQMFSQVQDKAFSAIQEVNTAANDREGQVDQKTIIIIAVAAVAAIGFFSLRGKK